MKQTYDKLTTLILEGLEGYTPAVLPYSFDALEPHIDAETMKLHYNKHYKGYVKKLNDAIGASQPPLEELVKKAANKKAAEFSAAFLFRICNQTYLRSRKAPRGSCGCGG